MTHRVSQITEHVYLAAAAGLRASQVTAHIFLENKELGVRESQVTAHVYLEIKTQSVRESQIVAHIFASMHNELDLIWIDLAEGESEVWGPTLERVVTPTQPDTLEREPNPYRPEIPFEFSQLGPIFHDFTKEQVETLRQQHMLIQAGDSTFGWEILTKVGTEKHYTLGSVGRFFHDDYGIILARYVQFGRILNTEWIGSPVGRVRDSDNAWIVTNDITRSAPELAVGVIGSFTLPAEGEYGWVIIDGQNIQAIQIDDLAPPARDTELGWSRSFAVKSGVPGKTLARIFKPQGDVNQPAGTVWIKPEGLSTAGIHALFETDFANIDAELTDLAIRVAVLEASTLGGDVTALTALVQDLQTRLDNEINSRIFADQQLAQRIAALEAAIVQSCCEALKLYVDEQDSVLQTQIDLLKSQLTSLTNTFNVYASQTNIRLSDAETAIAALEGRVEELESRPGAGLPLVTGAAGPVFVVDDWNQLIFVEI